MKKIILFLLLALSIKLSALKVDTLTVDSVKYYSSDYFEVPANVDTVLTVPNNNYPDSIYLVNITKGVITIINTTIKNPVVNTLLNNETIVGAIVALITSIGAWIHRRRTLRRWKKEGFEPPKRKKGAK